MAEAISKKRWDLLLLPILLLGTILRLIRLGQQSFWWDEVYSATLAAKSLVTVVPRFGQTPTFYHILLHFWLYMGRSDAMIRLFSVLSGVATLWAIYLLGKKLLDAKHGLLCAFLMAISPFHIWYSQEARMYSLLILLSTASVMFFIRFLHRQRGWSGVWWVLTTALALYTHYYAAFILLFQVGFFLLFWPQYRSRLPQLILALAAIAVMVIPIFVLLFSGGRYAAVCAVGAGNNPLQTFSIPYTFFVFSLGFSYGPSISELHMSTSWASVRPYLPQLLPAVLLFAAIFILGLRSLRRQRKRLIFLLLYLVVPIVGASLIALMLPRLSYNVRYVSMALPAYTLLLAGGLLAPKRRLVRWTLIVALVIVTFVSIYGYYRQDKYAKENYRLAAQIVAADSRVGDVILVTHLRPFEYYYKGDVAIRNLFWSPRFYRHMIRRRIGNSQRVWLVIARDWVSDPQGKIRGYMKSTYPAVRETTLANLYLGLFDVSSPKRN